MATHSLIHLLAVAIMACLTGCTHQASRDGMKHQNDRCFFGRAEVELVTPDKWAMEIMDPSQEPIGQLQKVYHREDELKAGLLRAIASPQRRSRNAFKLLCAVARPEDFEDLVEFVRREEQDQEVLAVWLASALVRPQSPETWLFLEDCVQCRFGRRDGTAFIPAIGALLLNGTPKAVDVLDRAAESIESSKGRESWEWKRLLDARTIVRKGQGEETLTDLIGASKRLKRLAEFHGLRNYRITGISLNGDGSRALLECLFFESSHLPQYFLILEKDSEDKWSIVAAFTGIVT